jgi:hypothetical protein
MTAARPYRMTPLTEKQALAELEKFSGIQFDPEVVEAFKKLIAQRPEWAKPNIHPELPRCSARASRPWASNREWFRPDLLPASERDRVSV